MMTDGSGFDYIFLISLIRFLFLLGYCGCRNYLSAGRWQYHQLLENFKNPDCLPNLLITADFACFFHELVSLGKVNISLVTYKVQIL